MITKTLKQVAYIIVLLIILLVPYFIFAQSGGADTSSLDPPSTKFFLEKLGGFAGYEPATETTISSIAGIIISLLLSILAIVFIGLMIYAGYNWMTASGDQAKVDTAKNTIRRSLIGLIVIVLSYAAWRFILNYFIYYQG